MRRPALSLTQFLIHKLRRTLKKAAYYSGFSRIFCGPLFALEPRHTR